MTVEAIVVHRDGRERLRATLEALARQTYRPTVCLVDNVSTDGTPEMLAADFPDTRLLRAERNLGFGAAVNWAIRTTDADFLVLLGDDAVPEPDFVARVVAAHDETGAHMVAACLRRRDGRIDSAGIEVDRSLVAFDALHGMPYPPVAEPVLLGPTGGAAGYSRAALEKVGGFDEGFFAYLEDVDLAIRLRQAGARCASAPEAVALHAGSATLTRGSRAKNALMGSAWALLLHKHGAGLSRRERLRGGFIHAAVFAGQMVIDRNAGAARGWIVARRRLRGTPRPAGDLTAVPRLDLSVAEALRRRLARRR